MPSARATACVRGAEPITNQVMTMMSTAPIASETTRKSRARGSREAGGFFGRVGQCSPRSTSLYLRVL